MLARLQKIITMFLAGGAVLWLALFSRHSHAIAIGGFLALTAGYMVFLGIEFGLLWLLHRGDPAPRAGVRSLLCAWIGESRIAPQIFCWHQPFRSQQVPDELGLPGLVSAGPGGKRGVVFIHGFFCNRGFWTPWLQRLSGSGHAFVAVNLEPVFGSIDDYAGQIDDAVTAVTEVTGLPPLLVCHSMGGLAARAWLRAYQHQGSEARVFHVVTIGTPHRGTWLARFGHGANGRQMRLGGDWHTKLDQGMTSGRHALFTCWYSNCDNIVFPPSTATLPGADNRLVTGAAHVQMAFLPQVMDSTLILLKAPLR